MNTDPNASACRWAFTLIELLTVITIIAILMGLLFPVIAIVKENARRAQARVDVGEISAAVRHYYTDYGKYPVGSNVTSPGQDLLYGEGGNSNQLLFDILRNIGSPNPYNPRGVPFFEGRNVSDATIPRAGIATQDAGTIKKGAFVDPWGQEYRIVVDSDGDNLIKPAGNFYNDFQGDNAPRTGCCVYSLGKDGVLGDKSFPGYYRQNGNGGKLSDDIISWQ